MRILCSLAGVVFADSAGASLAQSPFDGTWRIDYSKAKLDAKPLVVELAQGKYSCESCAPAYSVQANGTDQAVSGQSFDTLNVTEVD